MSISINCHLGVMLEAMRCISDMAGSESKVERAIDLAALEALHQVQSMAQDARRDLGIERDQYQVVIDISFKPGGP